MSEFDAAMSLRAIAEQFDEIDGLIPSLTDPTAAVELFQQLAGVVRIASTVRDDVQTRAGELLGPQKVVLPGVGMVKRTPRRNYRNWQTEDLLRAVLDSRRVDKETGEVLEETAEDRIRAVYPLAGGSARRTELRARGIDPDEFAEYEERGFTLRIETA